MAKKSKQKTKRIYYGPPGREKDLWWDVTVSPAKRAVSVNGDVAHALRATEGLTIGCAMSNMVYDNAKSFPHPIHLASATPSTLIAISRLKKNGSPAHGIIYTHHYKHITDSNDNGTLKKMVLENPSLMAREFTLHVPRTGKPSGRNSGGASKGGSRGQTFVPQGALARAIRAGRMPQHVADQLAKLGKKVA